MADYGFVQHNLDSEVMLLCLCLCLWPEAEGVVELYCEAASYEEAHLDSCWLVLKVAFFPLQLQTAPDPLLDAPQSQSCLHVAYAAWC